MKSKEMILADALKVAIKAEKKNIILTRVLIFSLILNIVLLALIIVR